MVAFCELERTEEKEIAVITQANVLYPHLPV